MENNGTLSASDVALLNGGGFGGMDNSFMWIFGLIILMGLFSNNGFGNGGYQPQYATQQDVQYTSQFGQLLDGNRDIVNNISSGTAQAVAAANQAKYDNISVMKDIQSALQLQLSGLSQMEQSIGDKMQECCCGINRNIDSVNYNAAINTANINENTTAQVQKVLDAIAGNRMADMQNQINQLQLQNAMAGVLKFPNQWTYAGGFFPPLVPPLPAPTTTTSASGSNG